MVEIGCRAGVSTGVGEELEFQSWSFIIQQVSTEYLLSAWPDGENKVSVECSLPLFFLCSIQVCFPKIKQF